MTENPVQPFLESPGYLVLDGGLASELEQGGFRIEALQAGYISGWKPLSFNYRGIARPG